MSTSPSINGSVRKWRRYPAFRKTDVPWLGDIPSDWKPMRLKFVVSKIGSGKTPKGGGEVYTDSGVVFLRSQNIHFDGLRLDDVVFIDEETDCEMLSTRVHSNDILLNITGASLGRCALVPADVPNANVNQHVCILRPRQAHIEPGFLNACIASNSVQAQIFSSENGVSREGLNYTQTANLYLAIPSTRDEQRLIVAFLDRETAKIDALIAKKERLIELLQEKRTAIISNAVTNGLDPRVPMKDSGVAWLGKIAAHFNVVRMARFVGRIEQGWSPQADDRKADDDEWAVTKLGAVFKGTFRSSEQKAMPTDLSPEIKYEVQAGDFLITRANTPDLVGDVCVVGNPRPKLMLCDLIYRVEVDENKVLKQYLALCLLSRMGRHQITCEARGSSQSMVKIAQGHIRAFIVVTPNLKEQARIVEAVDLETGKIDRLIARVREGVDKLREYRTALISAAVTGKIDVREEVA